MPRKYTRAEFIQKATEIHNIYDYTLVDYISWSSKVTIICPIHGLFEQRPNNHLMGQGCPSCGNNKIRAKKLQVGREKFCSDAAIKHQNKYDYSLVDYKNCRQKVQIICPIHGIFEQSPDGHLQGQGCSKCAGNIKLSADEVIKKAIEKHKNKYDYSQSLYTSMHTKMKILCFVHGIFEQTPANHLFGQGCPICRSSKGVLMIRDYLNKNDILYQTEKRFNDCRNKKPLPFDFWIPEYNTCIEYDGEQHYIPTTFGNDKSEETRNKNLKIYQFNDTIKTTYCEENGIKLIRIPFSSLNEIQQILQTELLT